MIPCVIMTAGFCFWIQGPTHYNRAVIIEGPKKQYQMLATPGTWKEATVSMATLLVIGLGMDIQAQNMQYGQPRSVELGVQPGMGLKCHSPWKNHIRGAMPGPSQDT